MPRLNLPLGAGGPALDLEVTASNLGGPPIRPPTPTVHTLIDTGANHTCIDGGWLRAARLTLIDVKQVRTASTGRTGASFDVYEVGLVVPGNPSQLLVPAVRVLAVDLTGYRFQCLLGRDVLAGCRFLYDGLGGRIELEF